MTGVPSVAAPFPSFPPGERHAGRSPGGGSVAPWGTGLPGSQETPSPPLGGGVPHGGAGLPALRRPCRHLWGRGCPLAPSSSGWGPGPLTELGRHALEPRWSQVEGGQQPWVWTQLGCRPAHGLGRRPNAHTACERPRLARLQEAGASHCLRPGTPASAERPAPAASLRGSVSIMWGCRSSSAGCGACPRPQLV